MVRLLSSSGGLAAALLVAGAPGLSWAAVGNPGAGRGVFTTQCSACHSDARSRPTIVGPPLFGVVGRRQVQDVLVSAINELSSEHRTVVDLTYFHEMGYREIAEIMACPVDTVKTRMYHARRHLKTKLSGQLADWL